MTVQLVGGGCGCTPVERKVLGQEAPILATETVLYTVPANREAIVGSLFAVNRGAGNIKIRIGVSVGGGALGAADYTHYDLPLSTGSTLKVTEGYFLQAGDEIRVETDVADASFSAHGLEYTVP